MEHDTRRAARTLAAFSGRDYAVPDDVVQIAVPALRHRVALTAEAEVEGQAVDNVLTELIRAVEVPRRLRSSRPKHSGCWPSRARHRRNVIRLGKLGRLLSRACSPWLIFRSGCRAGGSHYGASSVLEYDGRVSARPKMLTGAPRFQSVTRFTATASLWRRDTREATRRRTPCSA